MYDALVFIGRFQPFHKGHESVVKEALKQAKEVIVVVGSSFEARTLRNPFTFEERKSMIKAVFPQPEVKVVPVCDYPYNDAKWVAATQAVVYSAVKYSPDPTNIGLIGHSKDSSSFYLRIFPTWGSVEVPSLNNIHATDIRELLYNNQALYNQDNIEQELSSKVIALINYTIVSDSFKQLIEEYKVIKQYKEAWKSAPYSPTFVTVDAVVIQSGHVLLIKRKANPGKGLWALPGGFVNQEETIESSMIRELKEETKIKLPIPRLKGSIKDSKVFDAPNRSSRGRTITHAFLLDLGYEDKLIKVTAADDAEAVKWIPFHEVNREQLFEDHFSILDHFINIG